MSGSSNFLVFDSDKENMLNDADYAASSYRTGGVIAGVAPKEPHNKLFYQVSTMAAAWGEVFKNLGYTVSDADLASLVTVLSSILTTQGGTLANNKTITLGRAPITDMEAATRKFVTDNIFSLPVATSVVLGGVKKGPGVSIDPDGTINPNVYIVLQSNGESGFRKWSDGTIQQHIKATYAGGVYTNGYNITVNYPIAFTNQVNNVNVQVFGPFGDPWQQSCIYMQSVGLSSLTFRVLASTSGSFTTLPNTFYVSVDGI